MSVSKPIAYFILTVSMLWVAVAAAPQASFAGSFSAGGGSFGGGGAGGSFGGSGSGGGGMSGSGFFGGTINKVTYCTCYYDPAVIVSVKDLVSRQTVNVKYSVFYSLLHANYNVFEQGVNVIGNYISGDTQCRNTSGYSCTNNSSSDKVTGVISMVIGVGTSAK